MKIFKASQFLLPLCLALSAGFSYGEVREEVIFDVEERPSLDAFSLYGESLASTGERPGIMISPDGLVGKKGDGNFTAYKFADLQADDFTLKLIFEIPSGLRYSNSGVYLLYSPDDSASAPAEVRVLADARRKRFGAGPFELDYLSHEVQIIAGTDPSVPPENHGAGAFYGVDVGDKAGEQQILSPYELRIGDTYELTLISRGEYRRVFLRSLKHQSEAVLVSEMTNRTRQEDPVRGGAPSALLLQGFYNNGRDVQLPQFKRITLIRESSAH